MTAFIHLPTLHALAQLVAPPVIVPPALAGVHVEIGPGQSFYAANNGHAYMARRIVPATGAPAQGWHGAVLIPLALCLAAYHGRRKVGMLAAGDAQFIFEGQAFTPSGAYPPWDQITPGGSADAKRAYEALEGIARALDIGDLAAHPLVAGVHDVTFADDDGAFAAIAVPEDSSLVAVATGPPALDSSRSRRIHGRRNGRRR